MTKYSWQGIDFTVDESRFGLFTSYDKEGKGMVTSGSLEACVDATCRIQIPVILGTFDGYTSEARSSTVGGKL